MTKDEALKLALEALEEPHPGIRTSFADAITYREKVKQAIAAIKKALAQPQQEPVAWTVAGQVRDWSKDFSAYKTQHYVQPVYIFPPQPQQEPVAWYCMEHGEAETIWSKQQPPWEGQWKPLYTFPPPVATQHERPWIGLTIEDKKEYVAQDFGGCRFDAMDWAEKRLKEKNT